MRIGLVTDIHDHAAELARALAAFRQHGVDQVVTLGDTCDAFSRGKEGAAAVAEMLAAVGAVGVWGNHDFALCHKPSEAIRGRYAPGVLDFMTGMQPRLVIDDCHFSHEEAWIDAFDVTQLWAIEEQPLDYLERAQRSFTAVSQRCLFQGHHHRWWVGTPDGRVDWSGEGPLELRREGRYFVVVAPVFLGWCGIFDSVSCVLSPIFLGARD